MGLFDAIGIAGSGLTAERIRMDVTAENLANADTTKRAERPALPAPGGRARPARRRGGFSGALVGRARSRPAATQPAGGVQVTGIVADTTPDQQVYDPGNPEANAQGYVKMPNVSTVTEMTDLISEQQSYQSDVTAMQTAKSMFTSTLGLLK